MDTARPLDVFVLGWYGHRNVGDESYRIAFPKVFPQHRFTFSDQLGDVAKYDAVVLGGGNVLKPPYYAALAGAVAAGKPVYAVSVGCEGEFDCPVPFRHVYAREDHTLEQVRAKGGRASLLPDLAFSLDGDVAAGRVLIERAFSQEGQRLLDKVVTVVTNGYLMNGQLGGNPKHAAKFIAFSYDLAKVVDDTEASFLFLPFGTGSSYDDRAANAWVASKCRRPEKNVVMFQRASVGECLDVIAASDTVISTRLHSSIFAFNCGTPLIDITHHSKNENFLRLVGEKDPLSFWHLDEDLLRDRLRLGLGSGKHRRAEEFKRMLSGCSDEIHFD